MGNDSLRRPGYVLIALLLLAVGLSQPISADESEDQHWHLIMPAESGFSGFVNALTVYNGDLIAAGVFATAGKDTLNSIARWDGRKWRPLGSGMDAPIWCLTVYNGELIAGGEFRTAGGVPANGIARWDGSQWRPCGFGVRGLNKGESVHVAAMVEYNGELVVGGRFSYAGTTRIQSLARWNGKQWQDISYEIAGDVKALAVFKGELIATGDISEPSSGTVIQRFDGIDQWSVLGKGEPDNEVDAIFPYGDSLVCGGKFSEIGGVEALGLAFWNGTAWQPLGAGLGQDVWCLGRFDGKLIAAGANGSIASLHGNVWEKLGSGTNGDVSALLEFNQNLIVAGGFTRAGQVKAGRIAAWDKNSAVASDNEK